LVDETRLMIIVVHNIIINPRVALVAADVVMVMIVW
jgi:hypothetical protein